LGILQSLIPSKNKKNRPAYTKNNLNGNLITDSYEIAQEINFFFTIIGITLVQKLKATSNDNFLSYLKNPVSSSIFLTSTTLNEITDTINSLKNNKATGFDDISPYYLL